MPDSYESVILEQLERGIYVLTLNRPEKLNAMSRTMMAEIPAACAEVSAMPDAQVLIVTGAGRGFSAGADRSLVSERQGRDRSWSLPEAVGREAELLAPCEVPVIAAIRGPAAGAGMGLAVAADFRIMEPDAYFLEAHLALGLTPTVMCWWLPRLVGLSRATDIILRGRKVTAEEALEIGLLHEVVAADQLMPAAVALARELLAMPHFMLRMAKRSLHVAQDVTRLDAVREFGAIANRMAQLAVEERQEAGS